MNRRQYALAVLAVLAVAIALRLGSLFWSPLPYNPDGIVYSAGARDAIAAGNYRLESHATDDLGYLGLLVAIAQFTGQPPLYIAQPMSAVVGGSSSLVAVVLARRIASGLGWPLARARRAGVLAGALLAVDGLYLFRSMATDEVTAGFVAVPLLAIALARGIRTDDWRWGVLAVVLLAFLPPLHNMTSVLAAMVATAILGWWVVSRPEGWTPIVALVLGAGIWAWVIGYHAAFAGATPAGVVYAELVLEQPGRLVAWLVLLLVGVGWFVTTGRRLQRWAVGTVIGAWFLLLAVNAVRSVFPGTLSTPRTLLASLVPLAIPAMIGVAGIPWTVRDEGGSGDGVAALALVAGPVATIGFALSASLIPPYLAVSFRSHLFVHLPMAALAGVVTTYWLAGSRAPAGLPAWVRSGLAPAGSWLRAGLPAVLVVCAAVSVPVAFAGLELTSYETITTEAEFAGTEFAARHAAGPWATDDHLGRVARYHDGDRRSTVAPALGNRTGGGSVGPVRQWLVGGEPPPDCPVLAKDSWTTTGAQFHPQPPERIGADEFRAWSGERNVVYRGGARDGLALVAGPGPGGRRC